MLSIFRRLSAALAKSADKPFVCVRSGSNRVYITGVDALSEVEVCVPRSQHANIEAHITLGHLDRLGNANWALAQNPYVGPRHYAYPDTHKQDRLNLGLTKREAMALWDVLDRVQGEQLPGIEPGFLEPLRWTRDRLAREVQHYIEREQAVAHD